MTVQVACDVCGHLRKLVTKHQAASIGNGTNLFTTTVTSAIHRAHAIHDYFGPHSNDTDADDLYPAVTGPRT